MTVLTHHPCGPSQLYKRQACPGSLRMEARLPDIPSSSDAERGTNLHDAIDKPQQDDEMSLFDLKQVKVVREAMDEYGQECEWRYEVPFTIKIPFCEDHWGTADCVAKLPPLHLTCLACRHSPPVPQTRAPTRARSP